MRIDSTLLPLAAREHGRAHQADRPFPGKTTEKAGETAAPRRTGAENPAAQANSAAQRQAPAGLLAVLSKLQAMDPETLNHGHTQALASIERNLARYRENLPETVAAEETGPQESAAAEPQAPAVATEDAAKVDTTA